MIKLSGKDVTFGKNTVSQSGQRMLTKSGIRGSVLSGKRTTGFHWNGHRFPPPPAGSALYLPGYPAQGSVIQDFSGEGNNGTITGAVWKRLPSGLWYLDFDGLDDWVAFGSSSDLNPSTGEMAFKVWFNTSATGSQMVLAGNRLANNTVAGWWLVFQADDKIQFQVADGSTRVGPAGQAGYNDGLWHLAFVVYERSPDWLRIYLDGSLKASFDVTDDWDIMSATLFRIGATTQNSFDYTGFTALGAQLNQAPTAVEIKDIYKQELHLFGA
jgi:hypothetical protein